MKSQVGLILFIVVAMLAGCTNEPDQGPYRVRIPLESKTEPGVFKLETVTLRTVDKLYSMEGGIAHIRVGSAIRPDSGNEIGLVPEAKFIKSHGIYIPKDELTLRMTTLMYHLESVKTMLDSSKTNQNMPFPFVTLVDVPEVGGGTTTNAGFLPSLDLFYFLEHFFFGDKLRFAYNAGVIAHEYAHRIFWYDFFGTLDEESEVHNRLNAHLLKSLSEGVSDFVGRHYAGNNDWSYNSYPQELWDHDNQRDIEARTVYNVTKEEEFNKVRTVVSKGSASKLTSEERPFTMHNLGAHVARLLYAMSLEKGFDETMIIVNRWIKRLGVMEQRLALLRGDDYGEIHQDNYIYYREAIDLLVRIEPAGCADAIRIFGSLPRCGGKPQ